MQADQLVCKHEVEPRQGKGCRGVTAREPVAMLHVRVTLLCSTAVLNTQQLYSNMQHTSPDTVANIISSITSADLSTH